MSISRFQVVTDIHLVENLSAELKAILGAGEYALIVSRSAAANPSLGPVVKEFAPSAKVLVSPVESEPSVQWLESRLQDFRGPTLDHIVAMGGGSCIDAAKVFAAAHAHRSATSLSDLAHKERVATGSTPKIVAIPTTAGTGSEATSFATVWDRSSRKKISVEYASLTPSHALLTPSALCSLPNEVAAPPLLDAMSHALESLWNSDASEFSEAHACAALRNIFTYGPTFLQGARDTMTLRKIQWAATHSGIAIQQTRTSIAHAVSYALTLNWGVAHGHACSFLLPAIWNYVVACDPSRYMTLSAVLGHSSVDETESRVREMLRVGQTQDALRVAGVSEGDIRFHEVQQYSRSQNFSEPISSNLLSQWVRECL